MAGPRADRGRRISLSVQPGAGDPESHVDPDAGQPRHPPDLGSAHHCAQAAHRRDVRPERRGAGGRGRGSPRVQLSHGQAGAPLSDRAGGGRYRVSRTGPAHGRMDRAGDAGPRRGRAGRYRGDGRGGGVPLRRLSLGPLRHDRAAAVLPLWRDGKPGDDLPDADLHRRRPQPDGPGRARAGA